MEWERDHNGPRHSAISGLTDHSIKRPAKVFPPLTVHFLLSP
jgi:hypothetical protein